MEGDQALVMCSVQCIWRGIGVVPLRVQSWGYIEVVKRKGREGTGRDGKGPLAEIEDGVTSGTSKADVRGGDVVHCGFWPETCNGRKIIGHIVSCML
jgi:hypothetical protein